MIKPGKNTLRRWVKQINIELFGGKLPVDRLRVFSESGNMVYSGLYYPGRGHIILHHENHENHADMFATLAHEMIHFKQDTVDSPTNHNGKLFRHYRRKYMDSYGHIRNF